MKRPDQILTYLDVEQSGAVSLRSKQINSASREAAILMQAATGTDKAWMIAHGTEGCPSAVAEKFNSFVERRIKGEPVYRIIGAREFHGLKLALSAETLEPRDDTEALIEIALEQVKADGVDHDEACIFADLGTGTGAVALALLSELPNAKATVTDVSATALATALDNAKNHGFDARFKTLQGSWFDPLHGQTFDFIVSNPPYIASNIVNELEPEVLNFDPRIALDGGKDGLDAYREILSSAGGHIKTGGFVALEIGYDQQQAVQRLGETYGWELVSSKSDLDGNDRAVLFKNQS